MLKIITTEQAAQQLGVTTRTLRRWIQAGRMPAPEKIGIGGQMFWHWKQADLQRASKVKLHLKRGRKPKG